MTCPTCTGETEVVDSRRIPGTVKRRRRCLTCGLRFTTMEYVVKGFARVTLPIMKTA